MRLLTLYTYLVLFLGTCSILPVYAQDNFIDSLENLLQTNPPDSIKFKALREVAYAYQPIDVDKSIDYAELLLASSQQKGNNLYSGLAYNLLAESYSDKNYSFDTITNTFKKGLIEAEKANYPRLKAQLYNNMGLSYEKFGQIEKALDLYQKAYTILDEMGDMRTAVRILGNMAVVFNGNNDTISAKTYYLKAIEYATNIDDQIMVSQLGNNLANIYFEQKLIDSALVLYEKALEINQEAQNDYFTALSLANIGKVNIYKKQFEIAENYLIKSYNTGAKIKNTYCMGVALSYSCENYFQQKKHNKAIEAAKKALLILGDNGDMQTRTDFYEHLSKNYESIGNYTLAFKNQKIYHSFRDSIYNIGFNLLCTFGRC